MPAGFRQSGNWAAVAGLLLALTAPRLAAQITINPENRVTLNFSGFVQARYTLTNPVGMASAQTFDVALARMAFHGSALDPKVKYFFQVEASTLGNSNRISMLDAWLRYDLSGYLGVQAGRMLLPYSRQFYTHPGNLLFADLSLADYAFNLPRAIGAGASGKMGRISYYGAAMNSVRGLDAAGQQNVGKGVGAVGRAEYDILAPYGYIESLPRGAPKAQWSIGVAAASNPVAESSRFQNTMAGDRTRNVTVDSGFRWKRTSLQAAGYFRNVRAAEMAASGHWDVGSYAQAGVYVWPRRLELAGRYSRVDFGRRSAVFTGETYRETTVGANYYFIGHNLKLQGDYIQTRASLAAGTSNDRRFMMQFQILY